METGKYSVILADPAWDYKAWNPKTSQRYVGNQYQTMTPYAINALPVGDLAASNCALFLWATMPTLPQAFDTMSAWGFVYKTCAFTWVKTTRAGKPSMGMGFYTRSNAELCLLGIRGTMKRKDKGVAQVIMAPRREHSRKPDEVYERIMRLFDGPYLEMFARQRWPEWSVWGNQTALFPAQPFLFTEQSA
ncbi:MAG TPA: MT-A70 family methyltransferase [Ktedonobacterales bacterium]|nr:MT-A70 family methyltransferase [Ktedonobacterales bacterium]